MIEILKTCLVQEVDKTQSEIPDYTTLQMVQDKLLDKINIRAKGYSFSTIKYLNLSNLNISPMFMEFVVNQIFPKLYAIELVNVKFHKNSK